MQTWGGHSVRLFGVILVIGVVLVATFRLFTEERAGSDAEQISRVAKKSQASRASSPVFHASKETKLQRFRDACVGDSVSPARARALLDGLILDHVMADHLVDILGHQETIRYLRRRGDEFLQDMTDLELYGALLYQAYEESPESVLDTATDVGVKYIEERLFSKILAEGLVREDPQLINRLQRNFLDGELCATQVRPTVLIDSLLSEGNSFEEVLRLLGTVDGNLGFATYVVKSYFDPPGKKIIDLESEDGQAVLSFLENSNIINKEDFISGFIKRNAKGPSSEGERTRP